MAKVSFTSAAARRAWLKRRAKEQEDKRSKAAKKAAATRKRNARKGMKSVPPVTIKVDATQHSASTPQEFAAMVRDEARRLAKTLTFAQNYSAGPRTLERLVFGNVVDPKTHWRTGMGEVIAITDMSEEHLRNTVSFLARKLSTELTGAPFLRSLQPMLDSLSAMLSECRRRGLQV